MEESSVKRPIRSGGNLVDYDSSETDQSSTPAEWKDYIKASSDSDSSQILTKKQRKRLRRMSSGSESEKPVAKKKALSPVP
jgi:hypothetical protein